ncbi:MAG: DUF4105 domain-containing protein, partial [Flavobacteriales bacterium]
VAIVCIAHLQMKAAWAPLTPSAKFSVITCSPGPDLYSLFGHSAIRLQDSLGGEAIDIVFNYGVFDAFDDGFYVKFARGKLDYKLIAEYYEYFIESYMQEGRGVWEQELLLTPLQKQRLFDLLQANVQKSNCTYRYDFFYDNCSSRIRDMIMRATAMESTEAMGFRFVPLDTLLKVNTIEFDSPCARGTTYRQAIQKYLDYQPWSDFGIDLALGLPCDRVMGEYGFMFLPDSLMRELEVAKLSGSPLCSPPVELLPKRMELSANSFTAPISIFIAWLVLHAWLTFRRRNHPRVMAHEIILLSVVSLLSLLIILLWFFTDHNATHGNWNLLWACPLNGVLLFFMRKRMVVKFASMVNLAAGIVTLLSFAWLPISLNVAALPLIAMLIITNYRLHRIARIIEH